MGVCVEVEGGRVAAECCSDCSFSKFLLITLIDMGYILITWFVMNRGKPFKSTCGKHLLNVAYSVIRN